MVDQSMRFVCHSVLTFENGNEQGGGARLEFKVANPAARQERREVGQIITHFYKKWCDRP